MRKLALTIIFVFLLFGLLAAALQSPWGKEKAQSLLSDALKKSGFEIEMGSIEGALPNRIEIQNVKMVGRGYEIDAETIRLELSLLRLLKKEISFRSLFADGISWKKREEGSPSLIVSEEIKPSFFLTIEHFRLTRVSIPASFPTDFEGKLKFSKKSRLLDVTATQPEFPTGSAHLRLLVQNNGAAQIRGEIHTPTLAIFSGEELPFDAGATLYFSATGPLRSFLQKVPPLMQGRIRGSLHPKTSFPWIDRDWAFSGKFQTDKEGKASLFNLVAKSDLFLVKSKLSLDPHLRWEEGAIEIHSEPLLSSLPFPLKGELFANGTLERVGDNIQIKGGLQVPHLKIGNLEENPIQSSLDAIWHEGRINGSLLAKGKVAKQEFVAKSGFSYEKKGSFELSGIDLQGPGLSGRGALMLRPDGILIGTTEMHLDQLQNVDLGKRDIYGDLTLKTNWEEADSQQILHLDASSTDFYYGELHSESASIYSDLSDPFHALKGGLYINLEKAEWGTLELESASFETVRLDQNWDWRLFAEGRWKHPIEVHLSGLWSYTSPALLVDILNCNGTFFNHPFLLREPVSIESGPHLFRLSDLEITVENAKIFASIDRRAERTDARLKLDRLPIDFLSLNPLDVSIGGRVDLDTSIHARKERMQGSFTSRLSEMEILSSRGSEKMVGSGTLDGKFNQNQLDLAGKLNLNQTPLLNVQIYVPIHLSLWPFEAQLVADKGAKGKLFFEGQIEDILDFVDLGTHRLEGALHCDLSFRNTLKRPLLSGKIHFQNGLYQNYYTGTELQNIQVEALAEKQTLYLRSLTAQDKAQGNVSATGEIRCKMEELFPFRFTLQMQNLQCTDMDLATAFADGKIQIKGNSESAQATGNIEIVHSALTIPDHIPRPLPNLSVIYRNASKPPPPPQLQFFHPYPLHLDLHVVSRDPISIAGKGLDSEWRGDFHVGGTYTSPSAQGKLELIKGQFQFSSRTFKLTEGSLSLSGKEQEMPYLNLAGQIEQKGISIVARMKGPLNNPQLTFQSVPPLPMSSIMSYLLFGQDLSEITGFQALQLATSVAALAGTGPDVMESTRRSLGLDRLRIIAPPNPDIEGEGGTVAIQAGKYVAEGVIVSISQGAEDSSTNASIEVEIKDNFVFEAQTDQKQEQGKFTLKWTLNY